MITTRIAEHLKAHNWFAVATDFVIVVAGVFVGLPVNNWSAARDRAQRTARVVEAVRRDLRDAYEVEASFGQGVDAALAEFDAARGRGEYPPPVFLRIPGSDTPPRNIWQAVLQSQLADLIDPGLLFELGFYYDERAPIWVRHEHAWRADRRGRWRDIGTVTCGVIKEGDPA